MKKMIKVTALLIVLCTLVLCGCQTAPTEATYVIRVMDGADNPYSSGVIVQFMQDGEQVAMEAVGQNGKVEKTLPIGKYTVELKFTGNASDYYYDQENLTLTADRTALEIRVYGAISGEGEEVHDQNGKTTAYPIKTGYTYVELEKDKRNYFLFSPETAGVYRFTTSDGKAAVGYYGYTSYIRNDSILKVENGAMEMTITKSMIGSTGFANPHVIGIDAEDIDSCILLIERISDPPYSIEEDEPWVVYKPKANLDKFTAPEGTLTYFDLTAASDAYTLVFNETDKTYHLNTEDGPQILVQLTKPTTYLPAISEICTTTGVKKYFYDEKGEFVKREDYTACLQIYTNTDAESGKNVYVDLEKGVYPLTEDLKYIIQNHGEYVGWWDQDDPGFIFQDADGNQLVGLNPDIAWLFLCCYVES